MKPRYVYKQESRYGCPGIESVDRTTIVRGVAMKEEGDMIHFWDVRARGVRQRGISRGRVCGYSAENRPYSEIFPEDEFIEIAELERRVLLEIEEKKKQDEKREVA